MTDRSNETSGAQPPRPDEAAAIATPRPPDGPQPAAAAEADTKTRTGAARSGPARSGGAVGWILVIALILGGVTISPWWAPAVAPLLPWSARIASAPQAAASGDAGDAVDRR